MWKLIKFFCLPFQIYSLRFFTPCYAWETGLYRRNQCLPSSSWLGLANGKHLQDVKEWKEWGWDIYYCGSRPDRSAEVGCSSLPKVTGPGRGECPFLFTQLRSAASPCLCRCGSWVPESQGTPFSFSNSLNLTHTFVTRLVPQTLFNCTVWVCSLFPGGALFQGIIFLFS